MVLENRTVSFSLESDVVEGLKIPNDAIVEKSLIRIPRTCLTESMGSDGVLLMKGDKTQFTDLSIVTGDDDAVYIEQSEAGVKIGDIILQGTGEKHSTPFRNCSPMRVFMWQTALLLIL